MNAHHMVRVGEICDLINGKAFKPDDWSAEGQPIIRIQNLNDPTKPFNYWAGSLQGQVIVKPQDVLLAWSGTPGTSFGAHVWRGPPGILNQHIFRVDIDEKLVTKDWWVRAVNARLNILIGKAHGGVGLKHVTRRMVDELEIPLPPLDEQKRIAAILDQADNLRRLRQRAIDRLNDLGQAIFYEMFGDPSGERNWRYPLETLQTVCNKITDGTHQAPKWADYGIPFIFVSHIRQQEISLDVEKFVGEDEYRKLTKHTPIEVGDVLYTCVGSYGNTAVVQGNPKFVFQRHIAQIKPDPNQLDPKFLAFCLETPDLRQQADRVATGIAQKTVTLTGLKSLGIPLPPIDLQRQFSERVLQLDVLKRSHKLAARGATAFFSSLQHRAFTGQL